MENKLQRLVHKKEWQVMNNAPMSSGAGVFYIKDQKGDRKTGLLVGSATVQYIYNPYEDSHIQLNSMALAGTFGAGACGCRGLWSNTLTANGGSTTTLTTTAAISGLCLGRKIRFLTGTQAGKEVTVADVKILPGGTSTIYFVETLSGAIANNDTFACDTGKYYIMNAGTIAAGIFKSYDSLTGVVTSLGTTNLPATRGTDGRLVGTPSYVGSFDTGTATSGASTTITQTGKNRTVNSLTNHQVRITAGTGIGQVRTIASNTATVITVSSAWTVNPDATSVYAIEANDDFLYLFGNGAVTLYRYSISANTWTVLSPGAARGGNPGTGMGANRAGKTGNVKRADPTNLLDGRYIFSFRGGGVSTLDRYDIVANTWAAISYVNQAETFNTGSCFDVDGSRLYCRKDNTHRYFYYDIPGNTIQPFTINMTGDGTGVVGDKLFTVSYTSADAKVLTRVYSMSNTGNGLWRMLVI